MGALGIESPGFWFLKKVLAATHQTIVISRSCLRFVTCSQLLLLQRWVRVTISSMRAKSPRSVLPRHLSLDLIDTQLATIPATIVVRTIRTFRYRFIRRTNH